MKVLIFGNSNVGKTSLLKTTCEGYSFFQIMNLPPTRGIERENYLFRGVLELNAWDSGGQNKYIKRYFTDTQRKNIFGEVDLPIFMEDSSELHPEQAKLFKQFIENIFEFSPNVKKVYVLMNKTDLAEADPDKLFQLLNIEIDTKYSSLVEYTPVSVKDGTAQHRLIEILDNFLQDSVVSIQKVKSIRNILESFKNEIDSEIILINRQDGLIITSTLGEIKSKPLKFIPLDIAMMESNMDSIYASIQGYQGKNEEAMVLNSFIYHTPKNYIIFKEIEDQAMLVIVTKNKDWSNMSKIMQYFDNENEGIKKIKEKIKH